MGGPRFVGTRISLGWPGVEPLVAADPLEGLDLVESTSPDVVLLQANLGDLSLSKTIQQLRGFSSAPLLVLGQQSSEMVIHGFI